MDGLMGRLTAVSDLREATPRPTPAGLGSLALGPIPPGPIRAWLEHRRSELPGGSRH